jgi:hypothetical protein
LPLSIHPSGSAASVPDVEATDVLEKCASDNRLAAMVLRRRAIERLLTPQVRRCSEMADSLRWWAS